MKPADDQIAASKIDQLIDQLAESDVAENAADSTVRQLRAELETLAGEIRQPPPDGPFLQESALRRGLEFVKANGIELTHTDSPSEAAVCSRTRGWNRSES